MGTRYQIIVEPQDQPANTRLLFFAGCNHPPPTVSLFFHLHTVRSQSGARTLVSFSNGSFWFVSSVQEDKKKKNKSRQRWRRIKTYLFASLDLYTYTFYAKSYLFKDTFLLFYKIAASDVSFYLSSFVKDFVRPL